MDEPRKISDHLRELPQHDMVLATHADKIELTRDGGFPAGTRVLILVKGLSRESARALIADAQRWEAAYRKKCDELAVLTGVDGTRSKPPSDGCRTCHRPWTECEC